MSDLDKDFEKTLEQINAKLAEAATALSEANELRSKAGYNSFIFAVWQREEAYRTIKNRIEEEENRKPTSEEIYAEIEKIQDTYKKFDISELEGEMEAAGWSTSSSYC